MKINPASASAIVAEIGGILHQPVNVMDEHGVIVASTDPARVGSVHAGAVRIIERGLDELVIDTDNELAGARAGINLPIVFGRQIVGVIGLTGSRDQVELHGRIIKKMTEILLLDLDAQERARLDKRLRANFLSEWIFGDPISLDRSFAERGLRMGIDVTQPRRALAIALPPAAPETLEHDYHGAEASVLEAGGLFLRTASRAFCLFPDRPDSQMLALATGLQKTAPFAVGVGGSAPEDFRSLRAACLQAEKALDACLAIPGSPPAFYDRLGVELVLDEISPAVKAEYLRRVFHGCQPDELDETTLLLRTYYDLNGSVEKTAARLYIHKNTVQYRLRRLGELTGFDPRLFCNAARYELAIRFYREKRGGDPFLPEL